MRGKWAYNSSGGGEGRGESEGVKRRMEGSNRRRRPGCLSALADGRWADGEGTEPLPTHCYRVKERASVTVTGDA